MLPRRDYLISTATVAAGGLLHRALPAFARIRDTFKLKYILASSLYGTTPIHEVLSEVKKVGATHIDLWPKVHADHREQVAALGDEAFGDMLREHQVQLGMTTRYDLGPFKLADELEFIRKLGGRLIVTGAERVQGATTRDHVRGFVERLQPTVELAERLEVTVAIENHGGMMFNSPDAIRWFAEFARSPRLGLALAPSHLPQDADLLSKLIQDLGPKLVHFYAWEKGDGFLTKLPKEQELKQLPGRGKLDFAPLMAALRDSHYDGWVEIFMHPTPRGVPILESTAEVTRAVNESRQYLEAQLTTGAANSSSPTKGDS